MIVKLELLSDAVFGSGKSIPGGEDIGMNMVFLTLVGQTLREICVRR